MSAERARPALRAIRQEPMLVDDRLVAERLGARLSAETARWTRAWLVCWHAALLADDRFGRDEPWELPIPLDAVTVPKGGGDAARQLQALEALAEVGVVATYDAGDGAAGRRGTRTAMLARDAFRSHAAALAVDWPTVVARSGAEPAALLVMRALAELIVPLDGWSAVPRRDLMLRTGYQHKQVRVALRRLVAADLLLAEGDVGTTARYRLTPRTLGRPWPSEPAAQAGGPTPVAAAVAASVPTPAPPPSAVTAGQGVQLVIGGASVTIAAGASFEIGAGVAARVEIGPDGGLRMVIQTPTS